MFREREIIDLLEQIAKKVDSLILLSRNKKLNEISKEKK
jgi:hypothetical protein